MRYLKIDWELGFSSICDNKEEVIEGCGYDVDEITFEDLLIRMEGVYEIVEVTGDFQLKWICQE
jgi:hypothetical protein